MVAGAVLLFTRMDYLVNHRLYEHGLKFSEEWYSEYSLLYFLLYQFVIVLIGWFTHSWKLCVVLEAFVLSSAQDMVYFGLWEKGNFPKGDWTWMPLFKTFGTWKTEHQIILSFVAVIGAILAVKVI